MQGAVGAHTFLLQIPSGTVTHPELVTVTEQRQTPALQRFIPANEEVAAGFEVHFHGGQPKKELMMTISSPNIPTAGAVYQVKNGSLLPIPARMGKGKATFPFAPGSANTSFVVIAPRHALTSATSPVTGLPIVDELAQGLGAIAAGAGLLYVVSRRKKV